MAPGRLAYRLAAQVAGVHDGSADYPDQSTSRQRPVPAPGLLKLIDDKEFMSARQKERLKELLELWDSIECPETGCIPEKCPYALPIDWVEYRGYVNLHDLIEHLDQTKEINAIPVRKKTVDPLKAKWARRKGHYNP